MNAAGEEEEHSLRPEGGGKPLFFAQTALS